MKSFTNFKLEKIGKMEIEHFKSTFWNLFIFLLKIRYSETFEHFQYIAKPKYYIEPIFNSYFEESSMQKQFFKTKNL